MAMTGGSGPGGISSDINVTPLIDVLLVLLIIFMVIVPVVPKGLDALVPQPPKNPEQSKPDDRTIVVSVLHTNGGNAAYKINQDDVAKGDILARLTAIAQSASCSSRAMTMSTSHKLQTSSTSVIPRAWITSD